MSDRFKIVDSDNFCGDYPDEKFVNMPVTSEEGCKEIAEIINRECSGSDAPRHWKVVKEDYKLLPGFEP